MLASSSVSVSSVLDDNTESIARDCIGSESVDSTREHCELLSLERVKSSVWKHFGFPAKDSQFKEKDKKKWTTVYCKLCPSKLHYQGNMTNVMVHYIGVQPPC